MSCHLQLIGSSWKERRGMTEVIGHRGGRSGFDAASGGMVGNDSRRRWIVWWMMMIEKDRVLDEESCLSSL